MSRPPRLYDPSRKPGPPPTERQKVARDRNWRIFKLRGLYYHAFLLTGDRRSAMHALVDEELQALGALGQTDKHQRDFEVRQRQFEDDARLRRFIKALVGNRVVL